MLIKPFLASAGFLVLASAGVAQDRTVKQDAALIVDGVVRDVFQNPRLGSTDSLVQIDVRRSEGRRASAGNARVPFPGPGDTMYVHVAQTPAADAIPPAGAIIRAYLSPRSTGGWEAVAGPWFESITDRTAPASGGDATPAGPSLGMTTEAMKVKDRLVLRVTSVERGGPAETAGLEVGDVIVGAKGAALTGPDQIRDLARAADVVPLVVADVRTGRATQIDLRIGQRATANPGNDTKAESPAPAVPVRAFGVSAESVALGQRTALKVIRVEPGSPAAKAGIEVGDVLVAADGSPLTSPDQLAAAIRKSGATLTVTVRDSRTGRDVAVPVALGGPAAPANPVPELAPDAPAAKGRLGAVTELAFVDIEPAVKITEVEPGSPAARAGLTPGIMILKADGKTVMHPNTLNEIVRNSGGKVRLSTVDPRSGRKADVEVNLVQ